MTNYTHLNRDGTYRVQIIPVAGYIGDYPAYVWVNANTIADAITEARAMLRLKGLEPRNFELRINRQDKRG